MDLRDPARNGRRTHHKSHNRCYSEKQHGSENQLKHTVPDYWTGLQLCFHAHKLLLRMRSNRTPGSTCPFHLESSDTPSGERCYRLLSVLREVLRLVLSLVDNRHSALPAT